MKRCQHYPLVGVQCTLYEGHDGPHMDKYVVGQEDVEALRELRAFISKREQIPEGQSTVQHTIQLIMSLELSLEGWERGDYEA